MNQTWHSQGGLLAQAHAAAAEQARASATEDTARLRGDWVAACGERDANVATVLELRAELSRYRDATGKTAEVLEEEKARAADLTSKHRAQVGCDGPNSAAHSAAGLLVRTQKGPCCMSDSNLGTLRNRPACRYNGGTQPTQSPRTCSDTAPREPPLITLRHASAAQAEINRGLQAELARLREEKAVAESLGMCRGAEAADAAARAARLEADLRAAEARVRELEAVRRALHNAIQVRTTEKGTNTSGHDVS